MFLMSMASIAFAGTQLQPVSMAVDGAQAVAVRGIVAGIELVGTDGDEVRVTGTAGSGTVELDLQRKDGVLVVTAREKKADDVQVRIEVPRSLPALTVFDTTGPVSSRGLPTRLAVVHGTGPLDVEGAGSLRVQVQTGPVDARDIEGDLVLDDVTGPVKAHAIGGQLVASNVLGPVDTDEATGDSLTGGTPVPPRL